MENEIIASRGIKSGRELVKQVSLALHGHGLTFDEKLDLLGEVADYCEAKIQETWDEKLNEESDDETDG